MDVMDGVILTSMVVLVVFFAGVATLEWRDARRRRTGRRAGAEVIQHPQRSTRIHPAA